MTTRITFRLAAFTLSLAAFSLLAFHVNSADKVSGSAEPTNANESKPTSDRVEAPIPARVGMPAPNFRLVDQHGKMHELSQYKGKLVVMEWINPGCPFVVRHYKAGTMANLQEKFGGKDKDLVWLRINSTNTSHRDYRDAKATRAWAGEYELSGAILDDSKGIVGQMFEARTTPHMFVINPKGVLVYSGAIDNDPRGKKTAGETENYISAILTGWSDGQTIEAFANDSYGCNVKYEKKQTKAVSKK